jgi:hypothetical protein
MDSFWSQLVRFFYYFGLVLMLASLPLSNFFMSVAQFILTGVFLCDGVDSEKIAAFAKSHYRSVSILLIIPLSFKEGFLNLVRKFILFFKNKPALVFTTIILIDLIGLTYSTDIQYGLRVLRNNLPLFLLPLFLSAGPRIPAPLFHRFMLVYVAAVFAGSLNSIYLLINQDITDTRLISPLIHHIRFSLNICLAIFILGYYIVQPSIFRLKIRLTFIPLLLWLVLFLFILKALSGILAFVITLLLVSMLIVLRSDNRKFRIAFLAAFTAIFLGIAAYIGKTVHEYVTVDDVNIDNLEKFTPQGGSYSHDFNLGVEDGKYVGLYLCIDELQQAWDQRSDIPFDSLDIKGQEIRYTLIRYMNSKDIRKDANGVALLTKADVYYIENGVANVNYLKKFSIKNRIHQMILDYSTYKASGASAGSSSMERLELAHAAISIIRQNWLIGVGTGDLPDHFREQLVTMGSPLQNSKEGMFSSHNQFLNYAVSAGILGLTWFIVAMIYPAIILNRFRNYLFLVFFSVAIVSFLGDDTLKSQAGVTFFAFFYGLFVYRNELDP